MDSTVIPLCLKVFDWAAYRQRKGAIKLHTVLDYDTTLPVFIHMSEGKAADITIARELFLPKGSVLIADRAYLDFKWLHVLDSRGVFFVTRLKKNVQKQVLDNYCLTDKQERILSDQDIQLISPQGRKSYPNTLRTVKVFDPKRGKTITLLTNNLSWTAQTISQLYLARWDIEVFFKHIKQQLKIKTFVGTCPNAVLIQLWTAMIAILLLKYLQNKAKYPWHLSNLVAFLRINLFVKIDLWKWINHPFKPPKSVPIQLAMFS